MKYAGHLEFIKCLTKIAPKTLKSRPVSRSVDAAMPLVTNTATASTICVTPNPMDAPPAYCSYVMR